MALAEWLIPKPSLSAQAQLQHSLNTVRADGPANIEAVIRLTESLLQQNMHYQTLLKQAIAHVAELELSTLLSTHLPAED